MKYILFMLFSISSSIYSQDNQAKKAALEFVSTFIIEGDAAKTLPYFHPTAKGKSLKNLISMLKSESLPALDLKTVSLFRKNEIPRLKKSISAQYPNVGADSIDTILKRVSKNIGSNLGCLVIFLTKQEKEMPIINIFVFKKIDGSYRIIYQDDN